MNNVRLTNFKKNDINENPKNNHFNTQQNYNTNNSFTNFCVTKSSNFEVLQGNQKNIRKSNYYSNINKENCLLNKTIDNLKSSSEDSDDQCQEQVNHKNNKDDSNDLLGYNKKYEELKKSIILSQFSRSKTRNNKKKKTSYEMLRGNFNSSKIKDLKLFFSMSSTRSQTVNSYISVKNIFLYKNRKKTLDLPRKTKSRRFFSKEDIKETSKETKDFEKEFIIKSNKFIHKNKKDNKKSINNSNKLSNNTTNSSTRIINSNELVDKKTNNKNKSKLIDISNNSFNSSKSSLSINEKNNKSNEKSNKKSNEKSDEKSINKLPNNLKKFLLSENQGEINDKKNIFMSNFLRGSLNYINIMNKKYHILKNSNVFSSSTGNTYKNDFNNYLANKKFNDNYCQSIQFNNMRNDETNSNQNNLNLISNSYVFYLSKKLGYFDNFNRIKMIDEISELEKQKRFEKNKNINLISQEDIDDKNRKYSNNFIISPKKENKFTKKESMKNKSPRKASKRKVKRKFTDKSEKVSNSLQNGSNKSMLELINLFNNDDNMSFLTQKYVNDKKYHNDSKFNDFLVVSDKGKIEGNFNNKNNFNNNSSTKISSSIYSQHDNDDLSGTEQIFQKKSSEKISIKSSVFMIPHFKKAHKGGEDAYQIDDDNLLLVIADGVGGWNSKGIDPSEFSKLLVKNTLNEFKSLGKKIFNEDFSEINIRNYLQLAINKTIHLEGSSTLTFLNIDPVEKKAHTLYIGDSLYLIARFNSNSKEYELNFISYEQFYGFNLPYQVGKDCDSSFSAKLNEHDLENKDLLILATDGLWDNLSVDIIISSINQVKDHTTKDVNTTVLTELLVKKAQIVSFNK